MMREVRTIFAGLLVAAGINRGFALAWVICLVAWFPFGSEAGSPATNSTGAFVHPGLLHARADFQRMKQMMAKGVEPWKSGFEKLKRTGNHRPIGGCVGRLPTWSAIPATAGTSPN